MKGDLKRGKAIETRTCGQTKSKRANGEKTDTGKGVVGRALDIDQQA